MLITLGTFSATTITGPPRQVDQSDYLNTTISSEKAGCQSLISRNEINNIDRNQLTNDNLQARPFEPADESTCFPRGPRR